MAHELTLRAPGSKSLSHRAVICAALASGRSRLAGLLECDDTLRTMAVMRRCGASITREGEGAYAVTGIGGAPGMQSRLQLGKDGAVDCDMGESGTSCRILTSILAAGRGNFCVHGHGRLHDRPIGALVECLRALGADIAYQGKDGCPPLLIRAHGLAARELVSGPETPVISSDESSQYLSGLLLAAPFSPGGLTVSLGGKKAVSWPYVSLTLEAMERSSIRFALEERQGDTWRQTDWRALSAAQPGGHRFRVEEGAYRGCDFFVEGDWSGASYLLAAGAVGPAGVSVQGLSADSLQGDKALLDILRAMGASVRWSHEVIDGMEQDVAHVSPAPLRGVTVDMGSCPDLVPTVLAVAAQAQGTTRITNVAHLRIKESDRMAAPAEELRKVGCVVSHDHDSISLTPAPEGWRKMVSEIMFSAHNDHRLAMGLSLLGLPGLDASASYKKIRLDDPGCVKKSFPHFWDVWAVVNPA